MKGQKRSFLFCNVIVVYDSAQFSKIWNRQVINHFSIFYRGRSEMDLHVYKFYVYRGLVVGKGVWVYSNDEKMKSSISKGPLAFPTEASM